MRQLSNAQLDFIEELNKQQEESKMKAIKLSRTKVKEVIDASKGVYEVTFKKKDGTIREMLARQNVEHNLQGGVNKVVKPSNDYISTFDVNAFGYRTINLATITKLKVNGVKYMVKD